MQRLLLSEEELRDAYARAREIASGDSIASEDLEEYLKAGEEMGIPREATLQALRERLHGGAAGFAAGETVYAPSLDGFWYPAEVLEVGSHTARVRFLTGGEHTAALVDLRPLALVPGRQLQADWKTWGWWDCAVLQYDAEKGEVTVDAAGDRKTFPLTKTRLTRRIACPPNASERRAASLTRASLARCAMLAGAAGLFAGMLLDRLLPLLLPFLR